VGRPGSRETLTIHAPRPGCWGNRIGADSAAPASPPGGRARANNYLIAGFTLVLVALVVLWVTAPEWESALGLGPKEGPTAQFVSLNVTTWAFQGPAACWQGQLFSFGGTVPVAAAFEGSVSLPYPGGLTGANCTVRSVQVVTADFQLLNSNAPLTVPPGGAARLFVNVTVPDSTYSGPLGMSVTVVSP
jgi:hypothetical protein